MSLCKSLCSLVWAVLQIVYIGVQIIGVDVSIHVYDHHGIGSSLDIGSAFLDSEI
jgi:hypothetical protein